MQRQAPLALGVEPPRGHRFKRFPLQVLAPRRAGRVGRGQCGHLGQAGREPRVFGRGGRMQLAARRGHSRRQSPNLNSTRQGVSHATPRRRRNASRHLRAQRMISRSKRLQLPQQLPSPGGIGALLPAQFTDALAGLRGPLRGVAVQAETVQVGHQHCGRLPESGRRLRPCGLALRRGRRSGGRRGLGDAQIRLFRFSLGTIGQLGRCRLPSFGRSRFGERRRQRNFLNRGRLLAVGDRFALIVRCDDLNRMRRLSRFHDRRTRRGRLFDPAHDFAQRLDSLERAGRRLNRQLTGRFLKRRCQGGWLFRRNLVATPNVGSLAMNDHRRRFRQLAVLGLGPIADDFGSHEPLSPGTAGG